MLSRRPQVDPPIACELMLCELCGRWPDYCVLLNVGSDPDHPDDEPYEGDDGDWEEWDDDWGESGT